MRLSSVQTPGKGWVLRGSTSEQESLIQLSHLRWVILTSRESEIQDKASQSNELFHSLYYLFLM